MCATKETMSHAATVEETVLSPTVVLQANGSVSAAMPKATVIADATVDIDNGEG